MLIVRNTLRLGGLERGDLVDYSPMNQDDLVLTRLDEHVDRVDATVVGGPLTEGRRTCSPFFVRALRPTRPRMDESE